MRFNFVVGADDRRLAEPTVLGHLASVILWIGTHEQAAALHYNLHFEHPWSDKSDDDKCHDAARVAIAHALELCPPPGGTFDLFVAAEVQRWPGRLDAVG